MAEADSRGRRTVLIADPDPTVRRQLVRALTERLTGEQAVELQTCEGADSALSLLRGGRVDVAFIDQVVLVTGGPVLSAALADVEVVVANLPGSLVGREVPSFVRAFVERPERAPGGAVHAIVAALEVAQLKERARRAELRADAGEDTGEIVAASKAMRSLVTRARRVARTASPVLILGEPGTGKELLARFIYATSHRGSLVSIDASERSSDEIDQELALPAAARGRSVWERAEGGTLLLLHVERLSSAAQNALGSHLQRRSSSVRVIATADPTIRDLAKDGAFDRDLFLALGRPLLEIPALRQRREDIPLLANHFLLQFLHNKRETTRELRIGVEAMRALRRAPWPRNVAELEAAVVHGALVARTSTLVPGDLPDEEGSARALRSSLGEEPYTSARRRVLAEFERQYVDEVLERTEQNLAQAAREAGMDRANFRRLVKRAKGPSPTPGRKRKAAAKPRT